MQEFYYPWTVQRLLDRRPTLGGLIDLCGENYRSLLRIASDLRSFRGSYRFTSKDSVDLHLKVLEQTSYTTLIHLTHFFEDGDLYLSEPDIRLRAYHDARQVEVIALRQTAIPPGEWDGIPTLAVKWKINLFLSKWLGYCVREGYVFKPEKTPDLSRPTDKLTVSY